MKYRSRSVKLINNPNFLEGYDMWIRSREAIITEGKDKDHLIIGEKEEHISTYQKSVLKMNLQFNNFPYFIFEIKGSLLSRDILFNCTEFYQWSTSLRFIHSLNNKVNLDAFQVSDEFKGIKEYENQMNVFLKMITDEGLHPDDARLKMPYSVSTKYWIGVNLKVLSSFLGFTKIHLPWFYENYGKLFISEVPEIEDLIPPFMDDIYSKYFLPKNYIPGKHEFNDHIFLNTDMGMILYSQFIRQSSATSAGLYDMMKGLDVPPLITGDTPIKVAYTTHVDRFKRTLSNRMCAFSMSDSKSINSWYTVLEPYTKNMTVEEFKEMLPCKYSGNRLSFCKFREDIKFRNSKFEKNLPCSILCNSVKVAKKRLEKSDTSLNKLYLKLTEQIEESDVTLPYDYEDNL